MLEEYCGAIDDINMDYQTKKKVRGTIKKILKNTLPYGLSNKLFPSRPILEGVPPIIYNKDGDRILLAYIQDIHILHSPYGHTSGQYPKRILWDRYNYTLNTQFYTHQEIFNRRPRLNGQKQFGLLVESQNVCPDDYTLLLKHPEVVKELDALFTYDEELLDKYENAHFSFAGGPWYGTKHQGGVMDENLYYHKTKLLSMVSSAKTIRPLAKLRYDIALELHRRNLADVYGKCVGGWVTMDEVYTDYMFSIGIENTRNKYYFTEKLLNNFASMTIPVYYGATEVGKFFNADGIIEIPEPTVESAIQTLKQCTREEYESRKDAIFDNFYRVQNLLCVEDYLTAKYMDMFKF